VSKPEDIPQDVWDIADNLCAILTGDIATWHFQPGESSLVEVSKAAAVRLCRAIMAAKAEEREAAATECDRIAADTGTFRHFYRNGAADCAFVIRRRGNVSTARKSEIEA